MRAWRHLPSLLLLFTLQSCTPRIPKAALQLQPEALALRQLQTRRFDTKDEKSLLTAGATLLQDMGFQVEDSETELGVLVGSKDTDARQAGEIAGSIFLAVLIGADVPFAQTQKVRASLVTKPLNTAQTTLRVTFQRIVWNNKGVIHKVEGLTENTLYQDFFTKLSKAIFLDANSI